MTVPALCALCPHPVEAHVAPYGPCTACQRDHDPDAAHPYSEERP